MLKSAVYLPDRLCCIRFQLIIHNLRFSFFREPREGLAETVSEKFERILDYGKEGDREIMMQLAGIINGTDVRSVYVQLIVRC